MNFLRPVHIGLSILLLFRLTFASIPDINVQSKRAVVQGDQPPVSSREKIQTTERGLEKLSADLRERVEAEPIFSRSMAYEQESGDPLLVTALITPGADVQGFFTRSVRSREMAGVEWVTGEIDLFRLRKLVSVPQVQGVISTETYQTAEAPGLDALRMGPERISLKQARAVLAQGGPEKLMEKVRAVWQKEPDPRQNEDSRAQAETFLPAASAARGLLDVHDVHSAREKGYNGQDVIVGVVDTGVDFSHPDLQGTHAVIKNSGPYAGWPFAYDTASGVRYALDQNATIGPGNFGRYAGLTGFVHTLPVENEECDAETCRANLAIVPGASAWFTWPNTSKSHHYFYSVHPDLLLVLDANAIGINYPEGMLIPPILVVSDASATGKYDTVYVDMNYDYDLNAANERMTRERPYAGAILKRGINDDTVWDLSAGLLAWISDGVNQPPGVPVLYPDAIQTPPPAAGRMLVFVTDQHGHGTNCASLIVGQSKITDPYAIGPTNPLYAGGGEAGGVGGAVVAAMAPGAKIAAFQNGFYLPYDAWTLAVLGMDGNAATGDGVNIVSNSWGDSSEIADGWDAASRFAQLLSYTQAPSVSFLVATGNGGHGYGTVTAPGGGSIIDVGASTAYGALRGFETVGTDQFLYGDIQPWSNRGPGMLGDPAPDIVAVGAWGAAAVPLNSGWGNGQLAYDVFGGTSMSTPVAAGGMAVIYQAFREKNNRWPSWQEARHLLLTSASDLGYEVQAQGSGNLQVGRAVEMALGHAPTVIPSQWQVGRYGAEKYPAFPAILHAGEQDAQAFTVNNPTTAPVTVNLKGSLLQSAHEETFTFAYMAKEKGEEKTLPIFFKDITDWADPARLGFEPDLIRAQVILPFSNFDVERDGNVDTWWSVYFFDWMDHNGDKNLWTDDNRNGRVDEEELDIDADTGLAEYNRFTYGYPQSDYLEASLGRHSLSRRHDGVYLGIGCYFCGESTTLQVRVTFYRKVGWDWLTLSHGALQVPAQGQSNFQATLSVPPGTRPGAYDGEISVDFGGAVSILPVTVQVAADTTTFSFGGGEGLDTPYDNGHIFGGFNWNWRYESGDWRMLYTDIPAGTASPGKAMVVDTQWSSPETDIDTWLFEPAQDQYSQQHPELFGPYAMRLASGSENRYVRNGRFEWKTNTGTARELVSTPVQDGLNLIALHNVLNSGLQFAEQVDGRVYQVTSDPGQVTFTSMPDGNDPPYLSGRQAITFTSTADIPEGIQVQAFGMSPPIRMLDQIARQDLSADYCRATWVYQLEEGGLVSRNGGLLDITTTSESSDLDLDLYLFRDNGDGQWRCEEDTLDVYSVGAGADERIKIYFPDDGRYWVVVHGYQVPPNQNRFDLSIRLIDGADLTLENMPVGPVRANQAVTFTVNYHGSYSYPTPTELNGFLLIGTPATPNLIEVPVQAQPSILIYPAPALWTHSLAVAQIPVKFEMAVQNQGIQAETIQALIRLPGELMYQPGSAGEPEDFQYDPVQHTLYWEGQLGGKERITRAFWATAKPGVPPGQVEIRGEVSGVSSGQEWEVKTMVLINRYILVLPMIGR